MACTNKFVNFNEQCSETAFNNSSKNDAIIKLSFLLNTSSSALTEINCLDL